MSYSFLVNSLSKILLTIGTPTKSSEPVTQGSERRQGGRWSVQYCEPIVLQFRQFSTVATAAGPAHRNCRITVDSYSSTSRPPPRPRA